MSGSACLTLRDPFAQPHARLHKRRELPFVATSRRHSSKERADMKGSMRRSAFAPAWLAAALLVCVVSCVCCVDEAEAQKKASSTASVSVLINEVMAKNDKTLRDDEEKSSDWIELLVSAPSATTVNLSGWSLTDDPEHKEVWPFPSHDIAVSKDGFLVVYASGEEDDEEETKGKEKRDKSKAIDVLKPLKPLHASFKLSDKGDYLAVLDAEGKVADAIKRYPQQYKDISWGRTNGRVKTLSDLTLSGGATYAYLSRPTPGKANAGPVADNTPLISGVTKTTEAPLTTGEDLTVRACVSILSQRESQKEQSKTNLFENAKVELHYKVNFESRDYASEMKPVENGTHCDEDEGQKEFASVVRHHKFSGPAGTHPGDMIRWYVTVQRGSLAARSPSLEVEDPAESAADIPRYFGSVVASAEDAKSKVDKLYWFIRDDDKWKIEKSQCSAFPCLADKQGHLARCSFYFQGHFYDNVKMRQRGISALLWPKKKFKVDFKGANFKIRLSETEKMEVEEFNLQSHWEEPGEETYMRENVASDFFKEAGLPVFETLHVELIQNGRFYGLYSIIEQIDDHFLERVGYNPSGHLYKAFSGTASNLNERVPERLMDKVYRRGNKVEDEEDWSTLHTLTQSLAGKNPQYSSVEEYLYNHMNLPELVNELALQAAILNQDRCTKNYYVYFDTDLEEWSRFPWDLEAVMGISSALGGVPAPDYCMLVCPQFNSPLYCDSDHPQDPLPNYGSTRTSNYVRKATVVPGLETPEKNYNHLTDALLDTPSIRQMYLRRLKTIVDKYIATDYLKGRVKHYYSKISDSAKKDDSKWDTGDIAEGFEQLLKEQLPQRKEQLLSTYAVGGSDPLLPSSQNASEATLEIAKAYIPLKKEFMPSIEIRNPHEFAIDMSGWILTDSKNVSSARRQPQSKPYCDDVEPKNADYTCKDLVSWDACEVKSVKKEGVCRRSCDNCRLKDGPMRFTFAPGTVIPGNSSLFVTDNVVAYRKSLRKYDIFQFVVGPLDGKYAKKPPLKLYNNQNQVVS